MLYKVIDIFIHIHYNTRDYFLLSCDTDRCDRIPRIRTRGGNEPRPVQWVTEDGTEGLAIVCRRLLKSPIRLSFDFEGHPPLWFSNLDFNNKLAFKFLIIVADWGNFNSVARAGWSSVLFNLRKRNYIIIFWGGTSQQCAEKRKRTIYISCLTLVFILE